MTCRTCANKAVSEHGYCQDCTDRYIATSAWCPLCGAKVEFRRGRVSCANTDPAHQAMRWYCTNEACGLQASPPAWSELCRRLGKPIIGKDVAA